MLDNVFHGLRGVVIAAGSWLIVGAFIAGWLRVRGLRWTWSLAGLPLSAIVAPLSSGAAWFAVAVTVLAADTDVFSARSRPGIAAR